MQYIQIWPFKSLNQTNLIFFYGKELIFTLFTFFILMTFIRQFESNMTFSDSTSLTFASGINAASLFLSLKTFYNPIGILPILFYNSYFYIFTFFLTHLGDYYRAYSYVFSLLLLFLFFRSLEWDLHKSSFKIKKKKYERRKKERRIYPFQKISKYKDFSLLT